MRNEESVFRKGNLKYLVYLASVLLFTVLGMTAFQFLRVEPIRVVVKTAKGYYCQETVHSRSLSTVRSAVNKTDFLLEEDEVSINVDANTRVKDTDEISIVRKIHGSLHVDGEDRAYISSAHTVADLLKEEQITLGPLDEVSTALDAYLSDENADLTVYRVEKVQLPGEEILAYKTQNEDDPTLAYGKTVVSQKGVAGKATFVDEVTYANGIERSRVRISEEITPAVDEIIKVGSDFSKVVPDVKPGDIEGWRPYVIQALKMNGLEPTETRIGKVLRQIRTESNGNQKATQGIVDINSLRGTPAQGLMQTIGPTFNAHKFEGYDDIFNGYHNLLAAIHYAKARYGDNLSGLGEGHGY